MRLDVAQRFWSKVTKSTPVQCWLWRGASSRGYGYFGTGEKLVLAHRWSYEQSVGPIPAGATLDHLCRNRSCVNPSHLEPVSSRENVLRGVGYSALNARKTHCPQGHPLSGTNLYRNKGRRHCRACAKQRDKAVKAARKTMPHSRDRTHCPQGHEYAGDNLIIQGGRRVCRTCERAKFKRWYDKHRRVGHP